MPAAAVAAVKSVSEQPSSQRKKAELETSKSATANAKPSREADETWSITECLEHAAATALLKQWQLISRKVDSFGLEER